MAASNRNEIVAALRKEENRISAAVQETREKAKALETELKGVRSALAAMVSVGGRRIKTILVLGGRDQPEACTPCGGCRQRIAEFADHETDIVLLDGSGELTHFSLDSLLPASFTWPESS